MDGIPESVTLLLGPATMMTTESHGSELPAPDNGGVIADMRDRIDRLIPTATVPTTELGDQSHLEDI
jgi:hypothetical protein